MAIRTSSNAARSSSYSKPSVPKKPSSAQRSGSTQRASTPTQSRQTSSAPRRDTFTYSSPTAKQTPTKTPTSKTSTASKCSQSKTSTTKTNAPVRTSSTNQTKKAQPTSSWNSKRRDSFEFSSKDVEKSVRSTTNSKSTANGKSTTKNNTQNSTNGQTKKTVKNNSSNKNTVLGSASKSNKSSKNKVPEGLKLHLQHTNDPKQKAGMKKTIKDIENSSSSEKADKKNRKKTYISPNKTEVSSGIEFSIDDILKLDGSTVFVVNDGKYEKGENVVVDIDKNRAEIIMITSNEFNIDPTLIIAVMAHESRFQPNSSSGLASGLMQINNQYFPTFASDNKELIKDLGGDYTNIYDEVSNIVSWGAAYSSWVDIYGDNKDSLKALRQGNKGNGWTSAASQNAEEFIDIKRQLEENIK